MGNILDMIGKKFHKLTGKSLHRTEKNHAYWVFECECGNEVITRGTSVRYGTVKSCGCLQLQAVTKHENSHHKLYPIWNSMLQRCSNIKQVAYPEYGGRGITVCEEWSGSGGLLKFIEDMEDGYQNNLTIERVDVNKGYCKENCKWDTMSNQNYNKRKFKNNTSGKTGVSFNGDGREKPWAAYIYKNSIRISLDYWPTFEEAKAAREQAELEYYGYIKN